MEVIEKFKLIRASKNSMIDVTLDFIRGQLLQKVLYKVARVHLIAAEKVFITAPVSSDIETEIRVGIGHLRVAFYTYEECLSGRKKSWFKIVLYTEEISVYEKMTYISILISLLYHQINDDSSVHWGNLAKETFVKYQKSQLEYYNAPSFDSTYIGMADTTAGRGVDPDVADEIRRDFYKIANHVKELEDFLNS